MGCSYALSAWVCRSIRLHIFRVEYLLPLRATVVTKSSSERIVIDLELRYRLVLVGGHRHEFRFREHVTGHVTAGRGGLVLVAVLVAGEQRQRPADVTRFHHEYSRTILPQRTHDYL